MSAGKASATDLLGVAVAALRECADEKHPGHAVTVAEAALETIDRETPSDCEWDLVPRGEAARPDPDRGLWDAVQFAIVFAFLGYLAWLVAGLVR